MVSDPRPMTPWPGAGRPVAGNVEVEIRRRSGTVECGPAGMARWWHADALTQDEDPADDIVAYRLAAAPPAPDQSQRIAELEEALRFYADPLVYEIEYPTRTDGTFGMECKVDADHGDIARAALFVQPENGMHANDEVWGKEARP